VLEAVLPYAVFALMALVTFGWIAHLAFWAPWYRWGVRILRVDGLKLPLPDEPLGTAIETDSGKFKVQALDLVLVRSRQRMFGDGNAGWNVGTIEWRDGSAIFQARLELSYVIFIVYFVATWLVFGAADSSSGGISSQPLDSIFFAGILVTAVTGINVGFGRRRMRILLEEYEAWTRGDSPVSESAPELPAESSVDDSW